MKEGDWIKINTLGHYRLAEMVSSPSLSLLLFRLPLILLLFILLLSFSSFFFSLSLCFRLISCSLLKTHGEPFFPRGKPHLVSLPQSQAAADNPKLPVPSFRLVARQERPVSGMSEPRPLSHTYDVVHMNQISHVFILLQLFFSDIDKPHLFSPFLIMIASKC